MTKGGARKGAGRPALPDKKIAVSVKLPPGLIAWMRTQDKKRPELIELAMAAHYGLCPKCFRTMHRYHDCNLNPVADPK